MCTFDTSSAAGPATFRMHERSASAVRDLAECKADPSWAASITSTSGPRDILPPHDTELPPEALSSGDQGPATVLGLARNGDGNVEVTFSKPVFVQGEIVLYVLEPSTGGWELPLLGGSGTDTLIFSAAPEGKPALIVGESQIAWIGFGSDAQLVDANGVRANDLFDAWMYQ